ncbi:MAG: hypothetical protein PHQ28_00955 [Mycobacterium sp.]|nr:hypothetical protein [Mycobacterium sp.]
MTTRGIAELVRLRRVGVLQPDTDNDWSEDESAVIKHAYRYGDVAIRADIRQLFPGEAYEVDDET